MAYDLRYGSGRYKLLGHNVSLEKNGFKNDKITYISMRHLMRVGRYLIST